MRALIVCGLVSLVAALPVHRFASEFVDYLPATGGSRIILSAPHGGVVAPGHIPLRDAGCWDGSTCTFRHDCGTKDFDNCAVTTVRDMHTEELTRELRLQLCDLMGACPAAIINLLHRNRFDANREINEATFMEPDVVLAYNAYHQHIDEARLALNERPGLFFDMHGHGRSQQRDELGYLITGSTLDSGNEINPETTSIRSLNDMHPLIPFERLLRGENSFGDLLAANGFPSVPSPDLPGPGGISFFSGGYLTRRYGSRDGGNIDAIQIESARSFRDDIPNYAPALRNTINSYYQLHYSMI